MNKPYDFMKEANDENTEQVSMEGLDDSIDDGAVPSDDGEELEED